ncbi:uncharacterized protein PG998_005335 [Apiospora kogelbergensis]|uniref:uncharacterized protein n=1 Tax=Apiospora kogelbergensis TaxID=1337665 RepID=UPI00312D0AB5
MDAILGLSESSSSCPSDIKNLFDVDKVSGLKMNRYKPKGRNVVTRDGRRDGIKSWVLEKRFYRPSAQSLLGATQWAFPALLGPISVPPPIASNLGMLRGAIKGLGDAAQVNKVAVHSLKEENEQNDIAGGERIRRKFKATRGPEDVNSTLEGIST